MPKKPKLIQVEEDRWLLLKARAAALNVPLNDIVDQAFALYLIQTKDQSASAIQKRESDTESFYASATTTLSATGEGEFMNPPTAPMYVSSEDLDAAVERVLIKHGASLATLSSAIKTAAKKR